MDITYETNKAGSGLKKTLAARAKNLQLSVQRTARKTKISPSTRAAVQGIGFFAVLTYLTYQLSKIGWSEIFQALPTSPLFYVLTITMVATPILAEMIAFRTVSGLETFKHKKLFVRKQVFNEAVMSYTGEAYLVQQLTRLKKFDLRRLAIIIKDLAILRSFAANFWLVLLVLVALLSGNASVLKIIASSSPTLIISVSVIALSVLFGVILLFKKLTRLKMSLAGKIAAIYVSKSFIVASILVTQWSIAIPGKGISEWVIFLIAFTLSKKSPVGGDLIFASVVVTLPTLGGESAPIAAMLISIAAVIQLIYFLGFLLTSKFGFSVPSKQTTAQRLA